jgi:hypothetical protein
MDVPAIITAVIASGSTDFGSLNNPLLIILTPSPCDWIISAITPTEARLHRTG